MTWYLFKFTTKKEMPQNRVKFIHFEAVSFDDVVNFFSETSLFFEDYFYSGLDTPACENTSEYVDTDGFIHRVVNLESKNNHLNI